MCCLLFFIQFFGKVTAYIRQLPPVDMLLVITNNADKTILKAHYILRNTSTTVLYSHHKFLY